MTSLSRPIRRAASATLLALSLPFFNSALAAKVGDLEVVAELPIRPGNVAPSADNRVFATVHPFGAPAAAQLIEITGRDSYKPWPTSTVQRGTAAANDAQIDTPLGIAIDGKNRLWITDMGLNLGKTRLWGFDVATGSELYRIELPADIAPKDSFIQDLAVDDKEGWIYLADIANPGLIAVEISSGKTRRFSGHAALQAEPDARMVIGGVPIQFQGKPANVAVNPITLSVDHATLYFGAMNGKTWYSLPSKLLREGASDEQIAAAIQRVGAKPVPTAPAPTPRDGIFSPISTTMASTCSIPTARSSRWYATPDWTGRTACMWATTAGCISRSISCTKPRPSPVAPTAANRLIA